MPPFFTPEKAKGHMRQPLSNDTALSRAKLRLMGRRDSYFYTNLCFGLKHKWDETIPTACTNGKYIKYNPQFFMNLDEDEQVFLILHETLHVAYLHMDRLGNKDMKRWNIAADYVINYQLVSRGFKMPKGGLYDAKYAGLSAEQVYALLPDNPPEECDMDIIPSDEEFSEQLQADVKDMLVRAAIQSKIEGDKPGAIPEDIQIFLDRLLKPKLPWMRILQKYLHAFTKSDYSFRRPNRRFFPKHYLPSLVSDSLVNIAIAVDVSGSVSDSDFNRFVTEVASVLKMMKPEIITLIQFNSIVKSVTTISNIRELLHCEFRGRGGTEIGPVIEWANENKPQLILVFSDGEFDFEEETTKVPVIWVINDNKHFDAPYGKTIHYNI